ncbi:LacI family DNA-binding transcriptional regulator [Lichenifustis flavocetrariae]|uniref:LacI family transcriptional regulator n=1 Tax=Lichenifustis flavocetrariae TaxID=2949735 RepID=A0AA41Z4E6_9HYPH|nr:LacI family DNA-binding transcriptional regulator [Lichenifustis flavocetrariae]MCW6510283.1 LacI family transcriptional regulator [Lichenifustis flavocetrariae]
MHKQVTVADVARMAQVSKATAARALGDYGTVGAEVKQRVIEAARRLDYRVNELARTMATGRSGTIGVIVGDIENPFFGLAVRGVSDCAKAAGFDVILSNSSEDIVEERAAVDVMLAKGVDGLIVAPAMMRGTAHLEAVLKRGRPLVLLDRDVPGLDIDTALVDGKAATKEALRLLVEAGHRRIGYVTATEAPSPRYTGLSDITLSTVLNRIAGFLEGAAEAALPEPERYIRFGASSGVQGQGIIGDLLSAPDRPTAILASDSKIALDVMRAARSAGLVVPRHLSLVTFDDADWTSAVEPAITVIAQPTYELGREAARMLIERIQGERMAPRRCLLAAKIIVRESVARLEVQDVKHEPRRKTSPANQK